MKLDLRQSYRTLNQLPDPIQNFTTAVVRDLPRQPQLTSQTLNRSWRIAGWLKNPCVRL